MSRAYTPEEVRTQVIDNIKSLVNYWEGQANTSHEKLDGLAFSILSMIDGNGELPAFDLIPSPHPTDKPCHIEEGNNYYEPVVMNNCQLHEVYSNIHIK